jgi:hypothetical protein
MRSFEDRLVLGELMPVQPAAFFWPIGVSAVGVSHIITRSFIFIAHLPNL